MALNIPNIKRVRDVIAGLPDERFDMLSMFAKDREEPDLKPRQSLRAALAEDCGTAACIAGWTIAALRPRGGSGQLYIGYAGSLLGLSDYQASALFTPLRFYEPRRYSRAQAVAVLDHLIETGEVSWSDAPSRGQPATPMGRADAPGEGA